MATSTTRITMTRGDSASITGTLAPAVGRTFSTPITSLIFTVRRTTQATTTFAQKTVGAGVVILAQSSTAISFAVTLAAADTAALAAVETTLVWDLELTEGDGWRSTPVGGHLVVSPDVTT